MTEFTSEFMQGQMDCMAGKPHKLGVSESYTRGYSTQYELEQIKTEINLRNDYDYHRPTQTTFQP